VLRRQNQASAVPDLGDVNDSGFRCRDAARYVAQL